MPAAAKPPPAWASTPPKRAHTMTNKVLTLAYLALILALSSATGYYLGASFALIENHEQAKSRLHMFAAPALKGSLYD